MTLSLIVFRDYVIFSPKQNASGHQKNTADKIDNNADQQSNNHKSRHLLVIVNPFSGSKRAPAIFENTRRKFDEARITLTVEKTNYKGHAQEIVSNIHPSKYDGIVCIGGDGLIHEVINGLLTRADVDVARRIPIGVIPAGGGNGLASTLGATTIDAAVEIILSGATQPFDIAAITTNPDTKDSNTKSDNENNKVIYSFLFTGWGLISEMEQFQEKLRWLGSLKVFAAALVCIFLSGLDHFSCRLSLFPSSHFSMDSATRCLNRRGCPECERPYRNEDNTEQKEVTLLGAVSGAKLGEGVMFVISGNCSFLADNLNVVPFGHLADGYLDVVAVTKCTRLTLWKMLRQLGTGDHIYNPHIRYFRSRKFRFEVASESRSIPFNIDGELIPVSTPIEVEVMRGFCSVFCKPSDPHIAH